MMTSEIEYREYRREDAESFLRVHDAAFPEMSAESWDTFSRGPVTASVATVDGQVVGAVPFHFRDFQIRPDAVVRIAWEFSVCVHEDLRSRGIGSQLMDIAKEFLRDRCVAMAVYRGEERSPGYRYYARNGHHDMLYARRWKWRGTIVEPALPVRLETWEEFLAKEEEYLEVFASAYGTYGGFPRRHSGYYAPAVNTAMYNEVPAELAVLSQRSETGALHGYAIVGAEVHAPTLNLMEMATYCNDLAAAGSLLAAFTQMAAERGTSAIVTMCDSSPCVPVLRMLGFEPSLRSQSSMMIMAYVLDAPRLAKEVWRENEATENLEITAWTPEREVRLHRAARDVGRRVVLEMKEDMLTRLLFGRLDFRAACAQQIITVEGADHADIQAIAHALPYTPWMYHYLDYI